MTIYLVLDENVLVLSAKVKNDQGQDDNTCTQLISDILKNGDVIRCNDELFENYTKSLKEIERSVPSTAYTVKLIILLRAAGLISYWNNVPTGLIDENKLPSDDVYVVRLAANSKTDLVSTYQPLKSKMSKAKIFKNYNIKFLFPNEVYN